MAELDDEEARCEEEDEAGKKGEGSEATMSAGKFPYPIEAGIEAVRLQCLVC